MGAQSELVPPEVYRAALAAEAGTRDTAFLLDTPQPLCGVSVLPLDLRSQVILTHAGNPFICGGRADLCDVRMVLWLQSPGYRDRDADARTQFVNALPTMDEVRAVAEVRSWVDAAFVDAPPGKARRPGSEDVLIEEPIASFVASWVDLLASEYHWSEAEIVGTPARRGIALPRLYQYHRMIVRRHDPKRSFSSGTIVRLIGEWLRGSIAKDAAAAEAKE